MRPPNLRIHQIFYDRASREALDPEAIPLDNTAGPSDWYEFWPILNFLRENDLEEDTFYAFLSPSFTDKTGFTLQDVKRIAAQEHSRDVIVFSSFWILLMLIRNPWLHGESKHPGLLQRAQEFFDAVGADTDLASLWTDSKTAAFSNYLVAKPSYWRKWQYLAERYYAFVESQGPYGWHQDITTYRGEKSVSYKVFIQERLCSHILMSNCFDTFMPKHDFPPDWEISNPQKVRPILEEMDERKRLYRETGRLIHRLYVKRLAIAYSHATRRGSTAEWLGMRLRRRLGLTGLPERK